ncbi:hypothetical protein ABG067_008152, partial [Albugo candida]
MVKHVRQRLRARTSSKPALVVRPETPALQDTVSVELVEPTTNREAVVALPEPAGPREEGASSTTKGASSLPLILHRGPPLPVLVLEVQLHVPKDIPTVQPTSVVGHAKLQPLRRGTRLLHRWSHLKLEAKAVKVSPDVEPQRPNVSIPSLGWRMVRRPQLAVEKELAQLLLTVLPNENIQLVTGLRNLTELLAGNALDGR